jgi:hypothetical protein
VHGWQKEGDQQSPIPNGILLKNTFNRLSQNGGKARTIDL